MDAYRSYELTDDHTATNIADALNMLLCEWAIFEKEKQTVVTTDYGSNIVKAILEMGNVQITCFGHSLNTVITKIVDSSSLSLESVLTKNQKYESSEM